MILTTAVNALVLAVDANVKVTLVTNVAVIVLVEHILIAVVAVHRPGVRSIEQWSSDARCTHRLGWRVVCKGRVFESTL
jgi:hypothetical protein